MKAIAALVLFVMLAVPAFADSFSRREADRSGLAGTCKAVGNTVGGFFSSIGSAFHRVVSKAE